jgi:hypothetical protein
VRMRCGTLKRAVLMVPAAPLRGGRRRMDQASASVHPRVSVN